MKNPGCSTGDKLVLKRPPQLLIMNSAPIVAFVARIQKFSECSIFSDITTQVNCNEIAGLATLDSTQAGGDPSILKAFTELQPITNRKSTSV